MAIDFSQIASCAGSQCRKILPAPDRNIVGCDDLRPELSRFASDCLYSGAVSRFPAGLKQVSDGNFLLLADKPVPAALLESGCCNLLIMETQEDYDACIENIKRVFDVQIRVNNFSYGILNMCHENRGLQELLNAAYEAIGNPIMLVDASLFLMQQAGMETVRGEEQIDFILTHGLLPDIYLNAIMAEEAKRRGAVENALIVWESSFFKHRMVAGRILKNGHLIGYLKVLEYNRPITRLEEYYISILCKFFSITLDEFYGADPTGNPMVESFLHGLLEQKLTDADVIQSRAERIDLEFYDTKYVITAEFAEKYRNSDRLYLLKKQLKSLLNRSAVVVHQDAVVMLYDVKTPEDLSPEGLASLAAMLEEHGCRAAVSMPFRRLGDFYKSYVQTRSCLLTAQKLGRTEAVARYEDFIVEHMFLHFSDVFDLNDLVHPSVKLLLRHDREKNTDFAETLFCYVRHKNDITATAKAMNVHYNTLKYRINRIVELTGVDFDDEQTAFQLILSDKIAGLFRADITP